MMNFSRVLIAMGLATSLVIPVAMNAEDSTAYQRHERAVEAQKASDHHHHTGAKIVGGSAVGGAVVGGVLGGGKGALIGGALGAGGGAIANKERDNHDVKKREELERGAH